MIEPDYAAAAAFWTWARFSRNHPERIHVPIIVGPGTALALLDRHEMAEEERAKLRTNVTTILNNVSSYGGLCPLGCGTLIYRVPALGDLAADGSLHQCEPPDVGDNG